MTEVKKSGRCTATTLSGGRCKNSAHSGTGYCHVHMPSATALEINSIPVDEVAGSDIDAEAWSLADVEIPIEEEPTEQELNRRLRDELDALFGRLKELFPGLRVPDRQAGRLAELLDQQVGKLPDPLRPGLPGWLRKTMGEDLLDSETWRGMWYMANHTLRYQGDMLKRRLTGDYETDDWGLDWEFLEVVRPFLDFLYGVYWRTETTGIEHVPDYDRAVLVSNHSGQLPWDGVMIMTAVLNEHPAQRLVRNLYADWYPNLPFVAPILVKMGQALASVENGTRLLEQDELICVFPEGYKGASKLFKDRYKLARFGASGFVRMAMNAGAPIIPVSVVGAEETYIAIHQSRSLSGLTGFPYFPISLRFPWLGPLGAIPLPTKWYIDFGEPISLDDHGSEAAGDMALVSKLTDQVQSVIQEMVNDRLGQRRSAFY